MEIVSVLSTGVTEALISMVMAFASLTIGAFLLTSTIVILLISAFFITQKFIGSKKEEIIEKESF